MSDWDKQLNVGIEEIDEQHKALFLEVSKFARAYQAGTGKQAAVDILEFLSNYVNEHFTTEEYYMFKYNFPDRERHTVLHRRFSAKLKFYIEKSKSFTGLSSYAVAEMLQMVLKWLVAHIKTVDRVYGSYIKKKMEEAGVAN